MADMTHFKIIVPMFRCERWVQECLKSVILQTYENWEMIVLIDPCEDHTYEKVVELIKGSSCTNKIIVVRNRERKNVPRNHINGIEISNPANDDVVICLDGDDRLYSPDVLFYLNEVYSNPDVWITWGSYAFRHNLTLVGKASVPVTEEEFAGPRWWRYSHLKTFRYFLFKGIKDDDLKHTRTGTYYTVAGDMALMFPMVEMAGLFHCRYLDKLLYVYNQSTPYNDEKLYKDLVKECDTEIRNRSRYETSSKENLCNLPRKRLV